MSKQTINTSTATDTLASGFDKVNNNFDELYTSTMGTDTGWLGNVASPDRTVVLADWAGNIYSLQAISGTDTIDLTTLNTVITTMNVQIDVLTKKFAALQGALVIRKVPDSNSL